MSKFLDLVEKNTPINEGAEPLGQFMNRLDGLYNTDYMKTFIDSYHALVEDIQSEEPFEVEDIIKFLTFKMEEFTPSGGVPAEEDQELDLKDLEQVDTALATAEKIKSASNPGRPSRGVKKIEKSIGKLGDAVSKKMDMVSKSLK